MSDDTWTPDFGTLDRSVPTFDPKRPVRIAVLGDFSAGAARGRLDTGDDLARRKAVNVEFDNLEDVLGRSQLNLTLPIGSDGAGVEVAINDLEGFHPDTLYRELELFSALANLRKQLNNTATFAKAAKEVQSWAGDDAPVSRTRRKRSRSAAPAANARLSDFARLVGSAPDVNTDTPVSELLKRVVGPFVQAAPDPKRDALLATVDAALSDTMRSVLHQPEFQTLEALWRGMDMLLRRLETGPSLQVHLIDISAEEFAADLSQSSDLAESGLYKLLVEKATHDKNGGYALILGLYNFECAPPHAELLGRMAKIAAHASAPFITSIDAEPFMHKRKEPHPLMAEALAALKGLPEAASLALLMPRFLMRHPYGKRSDPISSFTFEEFTNSDGLRGMLWGHPALLAACALAAPTGSTLAIDDLPFHYFKDPDGDQIALPCTERLIGADAAMALRQVGVSSLLAHKGEPVVRFNGLLTMAGTALTLQLAKRPAMRVSVTSVADVDAAMTRAGGAAPAPAAKGKAKAAAPAASGGDDDDPLAGLGLDDDSSSSDSDSSSDSGSGDADLDALLASLGDDSSGDSGSDDAPAADAGGDDEMDPELAALLKSLE
ncbi:MAG: type VI secretion system contractile sheath domain-containing protein [Aquabacterium sp.]